MKEALKSIIIEPLIRHCISFCDTGFTFAVLFQMQNIKQIETLKYTNVKKMSLER